MRPYIGDGYDQTFYVKGESGLYPPVRFNGRLMAHHQAAATIREAGDGNTEAADKVFAAAMADRITGIAYNDDGQWKPLDDHGGNKLPMTAATMAGLSFGLFCRIRDIIVGLSPADADPEKGETKQPPTAADNVKN